MNSNNGNNNQNDPSVHSSLYLTKILLFTNKPFEITRQLKNQNFSSVNVNCLKTIGMYPLIERVDTPLGSISLSIWIINNHNRFDPFRLSYYSGASHTLIITDQEDFTDLFSIRPNGIKTTILKLHNDDSTYEEGFLVGNNNEEDINSTVIRQLDDISSLNSVFYDIGLRIIEDILSGEYRTYTTITNGPVHFNKEYYEKYQIKINDLLSKLGYTLNENGRVEVVRDEFVFIVDFYRNQVTSFLTNCFFCEEKCKYYRKLCVVEENQGYSNTIQQHDLRPLAILYLIHNGQFYNLTGRTRKEDIKYQLERLYKVYEENCKILQEENHFQKPRIKNKRKVLRN